MSDALCLIVTTMLVLLVLVGAYSAPDPSFSHPAPADEARRWWHEFRRMAAIYARFGGYHHGRLHGRAWWRARPWRIVLAAAAYAERRRRSGWLPF